MSLVPWWHLPPRLLLHFFPRLPRGYAGGKPGLILWATLVGKSVAGIVREANLLVPVAVAASLMDIFTVFWGFVSTMSHAAPKVVEALSVQAPAVETMKAQHLNVPVLSYIGIGDFLFLALFLTAASRHRMRAAAAMWAAFGFMFLASFLVGWSDIGLPGLPFISAGVLLVNRRYFKFSSEEKRSPGRGGGLGPRTDRRPRGASLAEARVEGMES